MKGSVFVKAGLVFISIGWNTYSYLKEMNDLTLCRMKLPELMEQYQTIEQDLQELEYVLNSMKTPAKFLHYLEKDSPFHIPTIDQTFRVDLRCQPQNRPVNLD